MNNKTIIEFGVRIMRLIQMIECLLATQQVNIVSFELSPSLVM